MNKTKDYTNDKEILKIVNYWNKERYDKIKEMINKNNELYLKLHDKSVKQYFKEKDFIKMLMLIQLFKDGRQKGGLFGCLFHEIACKF